MPSHTQQQQQQHECVPSTAATHSTADGNNNSSSSVALIEELEHLTACLLDERQDLNIDSLLVGFINYVFPPLCLVWFTYWMFVFRTH